MSTETGNVQCILCSSHINFMQDGKDKFYKHLKSEHSIFFSQDLIIAVNFLDIEITQQIVGNFDSQYTHIMNSYKPVARKESTSKFDGKENGEAMLDDLMDSDDDVVFLEESNVNENPLENHRDVEIPDPKNKTSFVCTQCDETFESTSVLVTHINYHEMYRIQNAKKIVNEQKKSTPCTVISCNETFSEEIDLQNHTMSAHTELKKSILCTEISCNEKFSEESDLQKHTISAHTKHNKLMPCTEILCNEAFSHQKDLQKHTLSAHTRKNRSISCTDISCTETFSEQSDFNKHIQFAHKIIRSPITLKQKAQVENNLMNNSHGNLDQGEDSIGNACNICGKIVKHIKYHIKNKHSTGNFPCPVCNKVFTSRNNQNSHTSKCCRKNTNLNKTVPSIAKNNDPFRKNAAKTILPSSSAVKETSEEITALNKKIVSSDDDKPTKRPKFTFNFISAGSSEKSKVQSNSEKSKGSKILEPVPAKNNAKEKVASTDDEDIQARKRPRRSCTFNTSYL